VPPPPPPPDDPELPPDVPPDAPELPPELAGGLVDPEPPASLLAVAEPPPPLDFPSPSPFDLGVEE
jgi:hypothetical protein